MNVVLRNILCAGTLVGLVGCGAIVRQVAPIVSNDLAVTSDIASRWDKPAVKQCADWMKLKVDSLLKADERLAAIMAEPTAGLLSKSLKAAIVADMLKEKADSANRDQIKKEFQDNCNAVAGDIMFNILEDAAIAAKRGN